MPSPPTCQLPHQQWRWLIRSVRISETFARLEEMSRRLSDTVPKQVVEYVYVCVRVDAEDRRIDRYQNPHVYTKATLSRALGENQYALGRVLGLEVCPELVCC